MSEDVDILSMLKDVLLDQTKDLVRSLSTLNSDAAMILVLLNKHELDEYKEALAALAGACQDGPEAVPEKTQVYFREKRKLLEIVIAFRQQLREYQLLLLEAALANGETPPGGIVNLERLREHYGLKKETVQ